MARSIHETRASFRQIRKRRYEDPEDRRADLKEARERLHRKRRIREQVSGERRTALPLLDGAKPESVPVDIESLGAALEHGVDARDLYAVMARLPADAWLGLAGIRLRLGLERMEEHAREIGDDVERDGEPERDPCFRRRGSELLPGVWGAPVWGTYWFDGQIDLYGFVLVAPVRAPEVVRLILRLRVLRIFVHELAHRRDHAVRTGRGRWRMDVDARDEAFARRWEEDWYWLAVVPHVEAEHADEVLAVSKWLEHETGERMTFAELLDFGLGDGGFFDSWFFFWVEEEDRTVARHVFVRYLLRSDRHVAAARGCARLLAEDPSDTTARLLLLKSQLHRGELEIAKATMATIATGIGPVDDDANGDLAALQLTYLAMIGDWPELVCRARLAESAATGWQKRRWVQWLVIAAARAGEVDEVARWLADGAYDAWGVVMHACAMLVAGDASGALAALRESNCADVSIAEPVGFVAAVCLADWPSAERWRAAIEQSEAGFPPIALANFGPLLREWLPEAVLRWNARAAD